MMSWSVAFETFLNIRCHRVGLPGGVVALEASFAIELSRYGKVFFWECDVSQRFLETDLVDSQRVLLTTTIIECSLREIVRKRSVRIHFFFRSRSLDLFTAARHLQFSEGNIAVDIRTSPGSKSFQLCNDP